MKAKKNTQFIHLFVLIIIGFSFLYLTLSLASNRQNSPSDNQAHVDNKFKSKDLNFSVEIPESFKVEERFTGVTLSNDEGKIIVNKNGTNFSSIDEYVEDLSVKNRFSTVGKQSEIINLLPVVVLTIQHRKTYFIYGTEWTVYTLSTDSPDLYDELDQIAQSFRYTP